ncbi:teichoic acids export ABC transporter ATP-binding subunit TagH [Ureibacillus sp. 179-F W5.1 NHS]|uniref:teichoic acids export ABC transporter ATP-binding subunit TagH n=1 Tax=Ureibacillus sp. 179-F W5.1 NHS TaxID=3374297 RepID=UPI0038790127
MRPKVEFKNVSKSYNLYHKQADKIAEMFSTKKKNEDFQAIKNVSFSIYEGDVVGLVGLNGAGKSTLSNLIAQIIPPTSGSININGETSLIAISVGLNNQLSGRENIRLKCLMHGISNVKIKQLLPEIIEFADIGKFIDQPVKNYSSGMKAKLGFAISVHINPDILIIDEALSVGDQTFYQKCIDKMNEFKNQGKTIIFISHSISQVQSFCNKVIWMNYGEIEMYDEVDTVIGKYQEFVKWFNGLSETEKKQYRHEKLQSQYKSENVKVESRSRSSRKTNKNKTWSFSFTAQLLVLVIALFIIVSFMFNLPFTNSINGLLKGDTESVHRSQNTSEEKEQEKKQEVTLINKNGFIAVEKANVYNSVDSTVSSSFLNFGNRVYITEQIDNRFKTTYDDKDIYVDQSDIILMEENLNESNFQLEDFVSAFPTEFSDSYMYFFAFLGGSYDQITSSMSTEPVESENGLGGRILSYPAYFVEYHFDDQGNANEIVINNIDIDAIGNLDLTNSKADDSTYFLQNETYEIFINDEINKISFSLK